MIVYHITGVGNVLSILMSGIFQPYSFNPMIGDNGLNLFDDRPGYNAGQQFPSQQCIIFFKCSLPISVTGPSVPNPLPAGILHDQHPWRMFIRGPIGNSSLRVTHVRIRNWAIDEYLEQTQPQNLPSFILSRFYRRWRFHLLSELRSLYRAQPAYIQVAA